jgi:DNA-binding CsgD family transcriptional regulator
VSTIESAPILGRERELVVIEGFLGAVPDGCIAMLISGEAGIGKTTLWREGVAAAERRGLRVLTTAPAQAETRLAFAGLQDLFDPVLDEVVGDLTPPQRRALEVSLLRVDPGGSPPDRRAVSVAALEVLEVLASRCPVVLAIDDVQWLDPTSARVLAFVARRLDRAPIGFLVAKREEAGARDPLDLERVFSPSAFRPLGVGALTVGAVGAVVRQRLSADLSHTIVTWLHDVSGGNPFFALEIGRAVLRDGLASAAGGPISVPQDLQTLVRARLAALPDATADVLLAVAASPSGRTSVDRLCRGTDHPERTIADLSPAVEEEVIEIRRGTVRFTHPLLAYAVYSMASLAQRLEVHGRLAANVEDHEERARHLGLAATGPDEGVAVELDDAATVALRRGAPDAAAELEILAITLTPESDAAALRARTIRAAELVFEAGDTRQAQVMLDELAGSMPAGPDRADVLLALTRFLWNDVGRIRRLIQQALRDAGERSPIGQRARLRCYLGWVGLMGGDLRACSEEGRAAVTLAERAEDPAACHSALIGVGYGEFFRGLPVHRTWERAIEIENSGILAGIDLNSSAGRIAGAEFMWAGDLDTAREALERDYRETLDRGSLSMLWESLVFLAELELRAGNWELAARYADQGFESTVDTGQEVAREVHLWSRALVAAHRGDVELARSSASEGLRIAEAHEDVFHIVTNRSVLGFLELSLGDQASAHTWLTPLVGLTERWGLEEPGAFPFLGDEIEALIGLGDLSLAESLLEKLESQGTALDRALALATAARCRGLLSAATGDVAGAMDAFTVALEQHERLPQPFDRARTLLASGEVQRRAKQKRAAREALEQALVEFEDVGAPLWAEKARGELRRIGGRKRAPDELSESELRVARAIATGCTTKEAAAKLFLSPKTVEAYLSRVYTKMGVRSRAELGTRIAELGPDDPS